MHLLLCKQVPCEIGPGYILLDSIEENMLRLRKKSKDADGNCRENPMENLPKNAAKVV